MLEFKTARKHNGDRERMRTGNRNDFMTKLSRDGIGGQMTSETDQVGDA
jgi:hypothetical protein